MEALLAEFQEKDKIRKYKQLLRVKKWQENHAEEYKQKKREYAKISYERKKALKNPVI